VNRAGRGVVDAGLARRRMGTLDQNAALARMPDVPHSSAADFVNPSTALLLVA
jgi:hypothetical protein